MPILKIINARVENLGYINSQQKKKLKMPGSTKLRETYAQSQDGFGQNMFRLTKGS